MNIAQALRMEQTGDVNTFYAGKRIKLLIKNYNYMLQCHEVYDIEGEITDIIMTQSAKYNRSIDNDYGFRSSLMAYIPNRTHEITIKLRDSSVTCKTEDNEIHSTRDSNRENN